MKHRNTTVLALLALVATLLPATVATADEHIFFSEIHYDNAGVDTGEAIEVTAPAGMDMTGWSIALYNGSNGTVYSNTDLAGLVPTEGAFTIHYPSNGIQNGAPDGFALVDASDSVVEFLSYEGTLVAIGGPADGRTSTDIGVQEPDTTPIGQSLQKEDDVWVGPQTSNFAAELDPLGPAEPTSYLISEIQGEGSTSPHQDELVSIEGVVVGDFQEDDGDHTDLDGFFVQEETGDQDGNPETSEGVFVFAPGAIDVSEGDVVEVIGTVDEFFGRTQVADVVEVEILGSGSVPATQVTLPVTATSDLEKYEGMLVTFPQALVISEFFNFDRFGEIVLTTDRQYQGTHVAEPGDDANAVTAANRLSRITLDDGRGNQNPDPAIHPNGEEFTLTNTFRGGDTVENVTGAMDWSFGLYRIQPTQGADYLNANPRPTSPDPIPGEVRVASFNVLNFFTHLDDGVNDICGPTATMECRGADTAEELDRQLAKLVAGILALDADIVGIQEIENDIRDDEPVFPNRAHDAVLTLVEALNEAEGSTAWAWVGEASHYNDYPVRNEIIYRKSAVSPMGDPVALADMAFDRTRPETVDEPVGRPPLAQTFRTHGPGAQSAFTVVVNHFKSKGSDCASIGDPDLGDGQGFCNLTRVAQSEALLDFVDELSEDSPGGVLVIGDLNSYRNEDPIDTLEAGGLTDLVESFVGEDAYSYVFDGQLGYLDTGLANDTMSNNVEGVTIFHINADEPDILDYDMSFKQDAQDALFEPLPYRVSDHDPVIVGLTIPRPGRGGPNR